MYQITRTNHITDEIQLNDGDKTMQVKVDLTVDQILQQYNRDLQAILSSKDQIITLSDDREIEAATARLGAAIVAFFGLIFGQEQTEKILEFYGGNHNDMFADFLPYLVNEIMPKIQQAQEDIAARYKTTLQQLRK